MGNCPKATFNKIQEILSTIDHNPKSVQAIIDCISNNWFFICLFWHETCIIDQENNNVKPTPPCKEVIEDMETDPKCKVTLNLMAKSYHLNTLCPALFSGEKTNFAEYPRRDIQKLESCQMNSKGLYLLCFFKKYCSHPKKMLP